ncbi:MAG: hypothetical protein D6778_02230 [Nitrospirae bacterium]|nr:MAG: hypothetical protein D6778_02230 [Nitrospirota bacterium]
MIKLLEEVEPSLRKVLVAILEEIERQRETTVTRKEFLEFARQTEENFKKVWQVINELAEAQKRTEREVSDLKTVVRELAEAQKKTEKKKKKLIGEHKKPEWTLVDFSIL